MVSTDEHLETHYLSLGFFSFDTGIFKLLTMWLFIPGRNGILLNKFVKVFLDVKQNIFDSNR